MNKNSKKECIKINSVSNSKFKNSVLRELLYFYRKTRFFLRSFLELPKYVYWGKAKINTRSWQTAGVLLWMKSRGLDTYEPETTDCFKQLLRESKCVWDVGAHVGYFSILSAQAGVRTYAFEMDPAFVKEIKKHARNNQLNIQVIEKPLGRRGQLIGYESYNGISINEAISADDFMRETGVVPDLIKIDIDGAEIDFLEGAKDLLTNSSPKIIMELSESRRNELMYKMGEYGYKKIKELDKDLSHNALFMKS
jgi:FkbM family methyltransferase